MNWINEMGVRERKVDGETRDEWCVFNQMYLDKLVHNDKQNILVNPLL